MHEDPLIGEAWLLSDREDQASNGDVVLLPPVLGQCVCNAEGAVVLDVSVPDGASV
jgi:hypothetical protein